MRTQLLASFLTSSILACGGDPGKPAKVPPTAEPTTPTAGAASDASANAPDRNPPGEVENPTVALTGNPIEKRIHTTYLGGVRTCMAEQKEQHPHLAGRVTVTFTIAEDGKATNNKASGINAALEACVVRKMMAWRFPKPTDENDRPTTMNVSLSFAMP